jgi:oligoendopeptidase F
MAIDPEGRSRLQPFKTGAELSQKCLRVFEKMNQDLARNFRRMMELNLLDLDSRKGKAPGGYNYEMMEARYPFIFMNSVGRDTDVRTLLHESGHAFHVFATRNKNLPYLYRGENIPTEFAEVASQAMQLMARQHLDGVFYTREEADRSVKEELEGVVQLLAWVATIDAFQHWIYTHPEHTREERWKHWESLKQRFGGLDSYQGYESNWRSRWQRQLHLYLYPFYYIEYGISMLGALGIWTGYRKDPEGALENYSRALALGGSQPLPELFQAAGVRFDFGPSTIEPYARELRSILIQN